MKNDNKPFFELGELLRKLRYAADRTHEDVSGAVEIEVEHLKAIEQGANRPSEEILLMLIQHLGVSDEHAEKLWQLAGYSGNPDMDEFLSSDNDDQASIDKDDLPQGLQQLPNVISMGITMADPRIVYTDLAKVEINDFGVVMNFHQLAGSPEAKPLAVAKVGMSREHAERIIKLLQTTLHQYDKQRQKAIEAPNTETKPTTKKSTKSQKSEKKNQ